MNNTGELSCHKGGGRKNWTQGEGKLNNSRMSRRSFIAVGSTVAGGAAVLPTVACRQSADQGRSKRRPSNGSFDPWVEIIGDAIQNNVREVYRFTKGARVLFVVKNNAYGLGIRTVGSIVARMDEIFGFAVARVDEALTLREVGIQKPVVIMSHVCECEAEELVRHNVLLTPFHQDARRQLERLSEKVHRPVPVHLFVDTGMNCIGMPHDRALPWIEDMAASKAVRIAGTYTMAAGGKRGDVPFDQVQLERFTKVIEGAQKKGIDMGVLHVAASRMIVETPESHKLGIVRPGHAIYGGAVYNVDSGGNRIMNLQPTFRLKARVIRVEVIKKGEGASFGHRYIASGPTWIATIPIGHTDGYPTRGADKASILIGGTLYPVIAGGVTSNFILVEIGEHKTVNVGDVATVLGPDHPAIAPQAVAEQIGYGYDYWIMTRLSALLHRMVV